MGKFPLGRIGEPGIEVGREKYGAWKLWAECLKDQKLVVYITPQYANCPEFSILRFLLFQRRCQSDEIIDLAAALGSLVRISLGRRRPSFVPCLAFGQNTLRILIAAPAFRFAALRCRQFAVKPCKIRVMRHPLRPFISPQLIYFSLQLRAGFTGTGFT